MCHLSSLPAGSNMIRDRLKELKAYSRNNDRHDSVIVFSDDLAQDIHSFLKEVIVKIIADTLEAQLKLNIISSRHEQFQKIEASIQEIRDLFVELALHVETQGEKMNCIRYLIEKSEVYTETTAAKLEKARARAIRKRRRCRKIKLVLGLTATIFGLILLI
ncbi:Syntaxin-1A, partial [Gryllus bimaculatus]